MLILTAIHLYNNKKNSQQTFSDIAISLSQQSSCHIKGKGKGKRTIRKLTRHMGSQCYLPPDKGEIPTPKTAEACTRLSDPG